MSLGPPTNRKPPPQPDVKWYPVRDKPWLEQSNETPPRVRTKDDPLSKGYR